MNQFSPKPKDISIHALLAESDRGEIDANSQQENFYPRSPCGERRAKPLHKYRTADISIHALLAESDHFATLKFVNPYISIHALLAESD